MKKQRFCIMALVMALVIVLTFPMTSNAASEISLNSTKVSVLVGKSYKLKLEGTKKKAKWSSSNQKIATVNSKGTIKGIKSGSCKVSAKIGKKKYTCKVTVKQPVTKIVLNKKTVNLASGKSAKLKAKVSPENATTKGVTWKSSNEYVATVSSKGKIKALAGGTVTITATAKDGSGKKASCKVVVDGNKCKHKIVKTGGFEATCFEAGRTERIDCQKCGMTLKESKLIPATGKHVEMIRNQKDSTFTEKGYTGDVYCKVCGAFLRKGQEIPVRTDYRTITITKSNWSTYFEIQDGKAYWGFNAFGDLEEIGIVQTIVLKPQYRAKVISELCKGDVEVSYEMGYHPFEYNLAQRTYKIGQNLGQIWNKTGVFEMEKLTVDRQGKVLTNVPEVPQEERAQEIPGYTIGGAWSFAPFDELNWYQTNITVNRIQGQLFFEL